LPGFIAPPGLEPKAAELLAGSVPRVILYAFTSSSYALGTQADHCAGGCYHPFALLERFKACTRYAQEELIAELGSTFLCARTGIQHVPQAATYVQSWLEALHNDRRWIFVTARKATEAGILVPRPPSAPLYQSLETRMAPEGSERGINAQPVR
jgi:hypothetical protein